MVEALFTRSDLDVNQACGGDEHMFTALMSAVKNGRTEVVRFLLDRDFAPNVDVNARDADGLTAMAYAMAANRMQEFR